MNVGDGEPDTGRDGSLPRAGAIKDRVNRAIDRLASLSRIENCVQLVGRPNQLGCLPLLTSEVVGRGRELWIWLILLAGGCPRGIGELVDELHYPGQLDQRNREHTRQCNAIKAFMTLQIARRGACHGRPADQPPGEHPQQARRVCGGIARDGGQLANGRATGATRAKARPNRSRRAGVGAVLFLVNVPAAH